MTACMCKPRTLPARKSGDRTCRACDTGLSQCPPRLTGTVVSSSGNHPTPLFWFFFPQFFPATLSKEPHTKELHFPASSYSHACYKFVGAQLVVWGKKAALCWQGMPVLERPTGLHSCPAPRQVLLSPCDSSEKLSQPLHSL